MKAPLRFMLGWLIWLMIFLAINYPMSVIWLAVQSQPWWLSVVSAWVALVLFAVLFAVCLRRFWVWCDAPRKPVLPASCELQEHA